MANQAKPSSEHESDPVESRSAGHSWLLPLLFGAAVPLLLLLTWRVQLPGPSGFYALFGRLPWSDGFDYWSAAQHLMQNGVLDEWGSRRPLNGAFLAARLALAGDRLLPALLIQSLLIGVAVTSLVRAVQILLGSLSSLLVGLMLIAVTVPVQSTTQSEGFGLLLGMAAMALLLGGATQARWGSAVAGTALLSIAMSVRPGAILMLPAIALWILLRRRRSVARHAGALLIVVAALLAGTAVGATARALYAQPSSAANANFSGTVLGLARGTDYYEATAWMRSSHPELALESGLAAETYAEAWREFRRAPAVLFKSLARNELAFLFRAWPILLLAIVGVWRAPRPERGLWIAGWLGILASIPIIYGDGGLRCLAASWPFALLSAASAFRRRASSAAQPTVVDVRASASRSVAGASSTMRVVRYRPGHAAVNAGIVALALALLGPWSMRRLGWFDGIPAPGSVGSDPLPRDGANEVDWVRGGAALHAVIVTAEAESPDRNLIGDVASGVPIIALETLAADPAVREFAEPLTQVSTPFLLCVVYDVNQHRARVFTLPFDRATIEAIATSTGTTALRIDSNPLRENGRVRVGIHVTPSAPK